MFLGKVLAWINKTCCKDQGAEDLDLSFGELGNETHLAVSIGFATFQHLLVKQEYPTKARQAFGRLILTPDRFW